MSAAEGPADLQRSVVEQLTAAGVPSPAPDARWLVAHVTGADGQVDHARLRDLVERRCARVPLQLLLGRWPFRGVELELVPGVFVPRPETEVVAGVAIAAAAAHGPHTVVVEPCTGAGAIAASLLDEVPGIEVVATERDPVAAALARRNLAAVATRRASANVRTATSSTWTVLVGDLLGPVPSRYRGRVGVLVANPPYLPLTDRGTLAPEVADHDPPAALFGGEDGHEVVDELLAAAPGWLAPGGTVVVELDDRRGPAAEATARTAGLTDVRLVRDLTGRDRALVARAPG